MKYKFILEGESLLDLNRYYTTCFCDGMSKSEKEEWIKENNLDPKTATVTKSKFKTN